MNILHVTSFFQPGMGYQENCLAPAQVRLGHEVSIVTSDVNPTHASLMGGSSAGYAPGRDSFEGVMLIRLPRAWFWPRHNWVWLKHLRKTIEGIAPDIVHVHNYVTVSSMQTLWLNRRRSWPLVVDDHNNSFNLEPLSKQKRFFYAAVKRLFTPRVLRGIARALPMSHEVADVLQSQWGLPPELMTLNFLGADANHFRPNADLRRRTRDELGISPDHIVFVCAGKLTVNKDVHVLFEAFARLLAEFPRAVLLLVGNAPDAYRQKLNEIAATFPISNALIWKPFANRGQLSDYYRAADVGVWPGDWSVTILEAAASGLPLLLPDRKYARYSVMYDNGVLFPRCDVAALLRCLGEMARSGHERARMGNLSRKLIEERLNWDALARETLEIYERCLSAVRTA